jgi:predicted transglutaminase-like cysteine proteinase
MGRQMLVFGIARAFRAIILACGVALMSQAASLAAATLNLSGPIDLRDSSAEPFGLLTSQSSGGGLRDKWLGVEHELDDELLVLALCQEDRLRCRSLPALQFLAIVDNAKAREGRARLGEINRAINLAIRPVSDLVQYGSIDVWSSPLATFARGAGDCEDYAIAKLVALRVSGIAAEDLRLVILRDTIRQEDHAVVAARLDGRWLMLDNRRMAMVEDAQLRNYRPTFVIDHQGVRQYSDAPMLLVGRNSDVDAAQAISAASPGGIGSSSN